MRLSPRNQKMQMSFQFLKKKDPRNVENYRPVSILPNLLRIYERYLYDEMYEYFKHILSK